MKAVLPRAWSRAIEAESREWTIECLGCGRERSVWDVGGIRFLAAGRPRIAIRCSGCGGDRGRLYRKPEAAA
ncbi:MAG: hypothetical protein WDN24_21225 [Sphingomonas sp.]